MSLSSIKVIRLFLVPALVLWVGGLGCVVGCDNLARSGAEESASMFAGHTQQAVTDSVVGETCAHAPDHACCAKHRAASSRAAAPKVFAGSKTTPGAERVTPPAMLAMPDGMVHTCPLTMNATALATKVRSDESTNSAALAPIPLPTMEDKRVRPTSPPTFFNDRGHTYLRCCVFLI